MGIVKKNKLHNPQIITDAPPTVVSEADIGRLWVDKATNTVSIAIGNKDTGIPELRNILDTTDLETIDGGYYRGIEEEFGIIELQTTGDAHFDAGYDFFTDSVYLENTNQTYDNFYSYYYKEVATTGSAGYIRTISTDSGVRHIRPAIGTDTYQYNSETKKLVNYSKIQLTADAKDIVSITFDNKDTLEAGFTLLDDNRTILIYADPEGFFINKTVKVRYLV